MSMGGNATKYDLKSSTRSPGVKNAGVDRSGHCIQIRCFIAKETCNLLKTAGNWYVHQSQGSARGE